MPEFCLGGRLQMPNRDYSPCVGSTCIRATFPISGLGQQTGPADVDLRAFARLGEHNFPDRPELCGPTGRRRG